MELINGGRKEKVVFIMGATGTGKSKLSIDLANTFPAEIINCDKFQAYKGLDLVTNKITEFEQFDIPHHLLGVLDHNVQFTTSDFSRLALQALESIVERNQLPIIVGGTNNNIEALVEDPEFRSNYECCFIWMNVTLDVLYKYLSMRVDQMIYAGMVNEVRELFDPCANYDFGVRCAIGIPELDMYLRMEPILNEESRIELLDNAIDEIKINTCELACHQMEKIQSFRKLKGWNVHRIDATEAFCKFGVEAAEAWEECVLEPSASIIACFLAADMDINENVQHSSATIATNIK